MATLATITAAFLILCFFLAYFSPHLASIICTSGFPPTAPHDKTQRTTARHSWPKVHITKAQLERLGRWEARQQNAVENYPLFVAAVIFGLLGKRDMGTFVGLGVGYTVTRLTYACAYVLTENAMYSSRICPQSRKLRYIT